MSAVHHHSLERRALTLGAANAIDYALQFILPIVLTRALDAHSFGEYRLLWLGVSTVCAITPMFMSESLYFFLPRSDGETRRLYVRQALIWMMAAAVLSAAFFSPLDPWLPRSLEPVLTHGLVVPLFVLLWLLSYLLDVLPTAEERVGWQANVIVALSVTRALSLSTVAFVTRDLQAVLWTLVAFASLRLTLLVWYIARHHGLAGEYARRSTFASQMRYAAPFGLSGMLHGLRLQADQWVAAWLFTVSMFASFSIATVLAPMVQLLRQSVNHVFLPSMSRSQSQGDYPTMLKLNGRANAMVALLAYPLLAFAFVFAEPLIEFIYTPAYLDAVPVLRIYTVGLVAFVVELVSLLFVLGQGAFAAWINALVLLLAVPTSYFCALHFGLPGAAAGSVVAIYAERLVSLQRLATLTSTPVARLQDWASLGATLCAAAISAAVAGLALHWVQWRPFWTLAAGAAVVAATYPLAMFAVGQRRRLFDFMASLRGRAAAA